MRWQCGIKESLHRGSVTLICLGNSSGEQALREGISLGADRAILINDSSLNNSDSYATAKALSKAIKCFPYDLILCGRKADDTQLGLVGAYIAQMLGVTLIQDVIQVEIGAAPNNIKTQRKLEKGNREIVECYTPALFTIECGPIKPRYPTRKSILEAERQSIEHLTLAQLGLSPDEVGIPGSKIQIKQLGSPKPKMKNLVIPDSKLNPLDRLKLISKGGVEKKQSKVLEGNPEVLASQIVQYLKQRRIIN